MKMNTSARKVNKTNKNIIVTIGIQIHISCMIINIKNKVNIMLQIVILIQLIFSVIMSHAYRLVILKGIIITT